MLSLWIGTGGTPPDLNPAGRAAGMATSRKVVLLFGVENLNAILGWIAIMLVARHMGAREGFEPGWFLAGPFGQGLGTDALFEGFLPLPVKVAA